MEIKNRFFALFTKELLMNSLDPWERKRIEEKKKKMAKLKKEMEILMQESMNVDFSKKNDESKLKTNEQNNTTQKFEQSPKIKKPTELEETPKEEKTPQPRHTQNLHKVEQMIQDPSVAVIECPGPGKFIIIKKGFKRFPTRVILNKDEINEILNYYSEEAKIPRIGGIFKAIIDNQVLTAIDSPHAGPRFIITKTRP